MKNLCLVFTCLVSLVFGNEQKVSDLAGVIGDIKALPRQQLSALDSLKELLQQNDPEARAAAIALMPALISHIYDENRKIADAAEYEAWLKLKVICLQILGELGKSEDAAVIELARIARDIKLGKSYVLRVNAQVRKNACRCLATSAIINGKAKAELAAIFSDQKVDLPIRTMAGQGLLFFYKRLDPQIYPDSSPLLETLIPVLTKPALSKSPDEQDYRLVGAKILAEIGKENRIALVALGKIFANTRQPNQPAKKFGQECEVALQALVSANNADAIEIFASQNAIPLLGNMIALQRSYSRAFREQAVKALGLIGRKDSKAVELLAKFIAGENEKLDYEQSEDLFKPYQGAIRYYDAAELAFFKTLAIKALAQAGQSNAAAVTQLKNLARAPNLFRGELISALGATGQMSAVEALVELINEPGALSEFERQLAIIAIGRVGQNNAGAFDTLISLAKNPAWTKLIIEELLEQFRIGNSNALAALMKIEAQDQVYYRLRRELAGIFKSWLQEKFTPGIAANCVNIVRTDSALWVKLSLLEALSDCSGILPSEKAKRFHQIIQPLMPDLKKLSARPAPNVFSQVCELAATFSDAGKDFIWLIPQINKKIIALADASGNDNSEIEADALAGLRALRKLAAEKCQPALDALVFLSVPAEPLEFAALEIVLVGNTGQLIKLEIIEIFGYLLSQKNYPNLRELLNELAVKDSDLGKKAQCVLYPR